MGRLHEYFKQNRDNLEDAVEKALAKADATIDNLERRIRELEGGVHEATKPEESNVVTADSTAKTRSKKAK